MLCFLQNAVRLGEGSSAVSERMVFSWRAAQERMVGRRRCCRAVDLRRDRGEEGWRLDEGGGGNRCC